MNEVLETIERRFSCRAFTSEMPEKSELTAIAQAAVKSPSAMNKQAWRVVVVSDKSLMDEMERAALAALSAMENKQMYNSVVARGGTLFYQAPCMIVMPMDRNSHAGAALDCGILCQTAALAASSLGIDNLICGFAGCAFLGEQAEYFENRLGFPQGFEFGAALLLGYAVNPGSPHKPSFDKISFVTG